MNLDFFIRRPIFSLVCSLVFIIGGIICIPTLPIAQFPDIAPPQITVNAVYIGASSEVVESAVTIPLEQEINGAEGVKYIASTSTDSGVSTITVTLEPYRHIDDAIVDIQNRIKRVEARLPDEVKRTGITVQKSSTSIVMVFGVYAEKDAYDSYFISNYVDRYVKEPLKRIKGVGEVRIFGERKYAMRLWLNPDKLASRGLSASDVVKALQEQNIQVAAGQIGQPPYNKGQDFQMSIKARSRLKEPKEFEEIVLKGGANGTLVKLKDVARVELGAEDYSTLLRFSGNENVVGVLVNQLPNSNALEVDKLVKAELTKIEKDFPPGLKYRVAFNPTEFVQKSIDEVVHTLIEAILLVILVIFLFLQSWRSTLIPAVTIPVSLVGTFLFVKIFGFSINTLTLFGLTLATGLVVDDAIVVLENISRFIEQKRMSPFEAALGAMKEIANAVVATSLVLMAVFIPVAFFPGSTGLLYRQFALTIAFSIAISLFNALTLSPALSALFLRSHKEKKKEGKFFEVVNNIIKAAREGYRKLLFLAFRRQTIVMIGFLVSIGAILFLYKIIPQSFVPVEDRGYFIVSVQGPSGSSLDHTSRVMSQVEAILMREPELQGLFAVGGFSFLGAGANKAMLFPALKPIEDRTKKEQSSLAIINRIRGQLMGIPGAIVVPFPPPAIAGLGNFGGFQYELKADGANIDLATLAQTTFQLSQVGNKQKELAGLFSGFTVNDPQVMIEVDRNKAKSLNVDLTEIFNTLQVFLGSQYVNDFDMLNRIYRVYVQADKEFRARPEAINTFYVRSKTGQMIPLSNLVKIQEVTAPQVISHFNLMRSAEINGSAAPGFSSGQAIEAMQRISKEILPQGMSFEWTGVAREQLESGSQSILLFALGLIFVFLILAAQYESFVDPLIIMMSVPLAILGGLLAQFLRGLENDVYCQIGLVMLVGLASKNAILIVEYANQLRESGFRLTRAIIQSALTRFRPIIMTSLAFILGVWPLVVAKGAGDASRHSLGTAVVGGMIVSTVLSLFIVPVLYFLVKSLQNKFQKSHKKDELQPSIAK